MSTLTQAVAAHAAGEKRQAGTGLMAMFGLGQVAGQIFRDVPSLLLLFFMTNTLGVAPAVAGVAIFVPKFVWGALCDLGVGAASDAWAARLPRRHWLLAGALLAPVAMVLLFSVPAGSPNERAAYVAMVFTAYMLVFAMLSVPYLTIGATLADTEQGRTAVMAWRLVFTAVGILVAASAGPILLQQWGGGEPAYRRLAGLLAAICTVCLLAAWWAAGRAPAPARASAQPALSSFWQALRSPRFLHLIGPVFLQLVGSGLAYAAMVYFITYNLGRKDAFVQLGIMVMLMTVAIAGAQPVWAALARRWGKRRTYLIATAGYALSQVVWGTLTAGVPIQASYAMAFVLAVFNSGCAVMSFSALGDAIAADAAEHGRERGGVFSALWVAADKIGFALGGTLIVGVLLSAFDFNSAVAMAGGAQPASALTGIAIAFAFLPAALNAVAMMWFARKARVA